MLRILGNGLCYFTFKSTERSRFKMDSHFINLIFIFALNIIFFFSGVCLNSVVIISFWRSVQLRKKLSNFMIMVLSCCDLLAVLTNMPLTALIAMLWLTGELNVNAVWPHLVSRVTIIFQAFSLLALLVMNFDRYLATSYPLYHRTSVTKGRLLTFLGILMMIEVCSALMSLNDDVTSFPVHLIIFFSLVSPPMIFLNYKLLLVIRKNRRGNRLSPEVRKTFSIKNISSCLLAAACYVTLSVPVFVYVGLMMTSTDATITLDSNADLIGKWALTIISLNSTFNCLIFYWKNKTLHTEGLKVMKSINLCGQV